MKNWITLLQKRAEEQPQQIAFTFLSDGELEQSTLTYSQLNLKAQAIGAYLQSKFPPGERALLLFPSGLDYISAFFGCLYAGIIAVPLYPPKNNRNFSRIQAILTDSEAKIALTTSSVLNNIKSGIDAHPGFKKVHWLASDQLNNELAKNLKEIEISPKSIAYLQYTSGSTSTPKGVIITHENALYNCAEIAQGWKTEPDSILVSWLPHFHDFGQVYAVLQPIYRGFRCIFMSPTSFIQKPIRWLQAISAYKATHSGGPNFAYDLCVSKIQPKDINSLDLSYWTVAVNGAEPVRHQTLETFYKTFAPCGFSWESFCPSYGLAEATLTVSYGSTNPYFFNIDTDALKQNHILEVPQFEGQTLVSSGKNILSTQVTIVDPESRTECPPDTVGEIWVSSPSIAKGYWHRPEETQKTFQAKLVNDEKTNYLRTGDLGFIKDGELFITGRIKDLIIIRGSNHYPQDLELTVEQAHHSIRAGYGAAFSIEENDEEKLVIAYEIERTQIRKLNAEEVIRAIRHAISEEHSLDVHAVLLLKTGGIPKTSSGKIQRQICRQQFLNQELEIIAKWQEETKKPLINNQKEETKKPDMDKTNLSNLIQFNIQNEVLSWISTHKKIDINKITIDKPLAYYGLSSLEIFNLFGDLETWLGYSITPDWFWDSESIEELISKLFQGWINASSNPKKISI